MLAGKSSGGHSSPSSVRTVTSWASRVAYRPTTWSLRNPTMRSAEGLQDRISPSASMSRMPSSSASNIDRWRSSLRATSSVERRCSVTSRLMTVTPVMAPLASRTGAAWTQ